MFNSTTIAPQLYLFKCATGARSSSRIVKNLGAWGHPQQATGKRYVLRSTLLASFVIAARYPACQQLYHFPGFVIIPFLSPIYNEASWFNLNLNVD